MVWLLLVFRGVRGLGQSKYRDWHMIYDAATILKLKQETAISTSTSIIIYIFIENKQFSGRYAISVYPCLCIII